MENSRNFMNFAITICALCIAGLAVIFGIIQFKNLSSPVGIITVEGSGYANAVPDLAIINFTIHNEAKTTAAAQEIIKQKSEQALELLKKSGIEQKDIKTENYSTNPKYEYPAAPICAKLPCLSRPSPVLLGYEGRQVVEVKVRQIDKVSDLLIALGAIEINELSAPNFIVEDVTKSQEEARAKAIEAAKLKAKKLSRELGVKLGRITTFNENNNSYQPRMYMAVAAATEKSSITPGENKITSNVFISYEIK
jgi:uncharacterized protein YggE